MVKYERIRGFVYKDLNNIENLSCRKISNNLIDYIGDNLEYELNDTFQAVVIPIIQIPYKVYIYGEELKANLYSLYIEIPSEIYNKKTSLDKNTFLKEIRKFLNESSGFRAYMIRDTYLFLNHKLGCKHEDSYIYRWSPEYFFLDLYATFAKYQRSYLNIKIETVLRYADVYPLENAVKNINYKRIEELYSLEKNNKKLPVDLITDFISYLIKEVSKLNKPKNIEIFSSKSNPKSEFYKSVSNIQTSLFKLLNK